MLASDSTSRPLDGDNFSVFSDIDFQNDILLMFSCEIRQFGGWKSKASEQSTVMPRS